jgi:hypothetical protein
MENYFIKYSENMVVTIITEFGMVTLFNPSYQLLEDWKELIY